MYEVSGPPFRLSIYRSNGDSVLAVRGELDLATAPALERAARELLVATPWLALDLEATTFIDASGYRLIQTLGERARRASGEVTLTGRSASVQRLLGLLGPPPSVRLAGGGVAPKAAASLEGVL
jgi:anti-anti-sigma factor